MKKPANKGGIDRRLDQPLRERLDKLIARAYGKGNANEQEIAIRRCQSYASANGISLDYWIGMFQKCGTIRSDVFARNADLSDPAMVALVPALQKPIQSAALVAALAKEAKKEADRLARARIKKGKKITSKNIHLFLLADLQKVDQDQ